MHLFWIMWNTTSLVIITHRGNSFKLVILRWLVLIDLCIGTKLWCCGGGRIECMWKGEYFIEVIKWLIIQILELFNPPPLEIVGIWIKTTITEWRGITDRKIPAIADECNHLLGTLGININRPWICSFTQASSWWCIQAQTMGTRLEVRDGKNTN